MPASYVGIRSLSGMPFTFTAAVYVAIGRRIGWGYQCILLCIPINGRNRLNKSRGWPKGGSGSPARLMAC